MLQGRISHTCRMRCNLIISALFLTRGDEKYLNWNNRMVSFCDEEDESIMAQQSRDSVCPTYEQVFVPMDIFSVFWGKEGCCCLSIKSCGTIPARDLSGLWLCVLFMHVGVFIWMNYVKENIRIQCEVKTRQTVRRRITFCGRILGNWEIMLKGLLTFSIFHAVCVYFCLK